MNLPESPQVPTLFLDRELRVVSLDPAAAEILRIGQSDIGRPIAQVETCIAFDELEDDIRHVLRTLGSAEREFRDPATGSHYTIHIRPHGSGDDAATGVALSIVHRVPGTERALRESEEGYRSLAELSPDGILIKADGRFVYANRAAVRLLGAKSADEVCGRSLYDFVQPSRQENMQERIARVLQGYYNPPMEVQFQRLDGESIMVEAVAGPLNWHGIPAVQILLRDITQRKHAEDEQKLLLAELQHRVRNTLAVVRSIARRTANTSETVEDYAMHLDGRLNAFGRVQAVVTRDPASGVSLEYLIAEELLSYAAHEGEQVEISGPEVRLQAKAAETFGLAVHELATNAIKYGALSVLDGRIVVTWRIEEAEDTPRLVFDWKETGVVLTDEKPARNGFGTELIERTLVYDLGAETSLRFEPTGLHCTISLPLTDRITVVGQRH